MQTQMYCTLVGLVDLLVKIPKKADLHVTMFHPKQLYINPILHTWFRDSCFTCYGTSTILTFKYVMASEPYRYT
jgi:hypothetical protein